MIDNCALGIDDSVEPLLTPEELAQRLKVKRSWVYTHADRLGAIRLGKYLRFSWSKTLAKLIGRESTLRKA